jgi:hypothetical protein
MSTDLAEHAGNCDTERLIFKLKAHEARGLWAMQLITYRRFRAFIRAHRVHASADTRQSALSDYLMKFHNIGGETADRFAFIQI